ncbi:chorismate-binding protein [Candidatus Vidania fulgoroideorum]
MFFKKIKYLNLIKISNIFFKKKYFIFLYKDYKNFNRYSFLSFYKLDKSCFIKKKLNFKEYFLFEKFLNIKKLKFGLLNFSLTYFLNYLKNKNTKIIFFFPKLLFLVDNLKKKYFILSFFSKNKSLILFKKIKKRIKKNIKIFKFCFRYIYNVPTFLDYSILFKKIKKKIYKGNIMQLQISKKNILKIKKKYIFSIYNNMSLCNKNYNLFLYLKKKIISSFSPEFLFIINKNKISFSPIAGTSKRGKNILEDKIKEKNLINDKKELAEHLMLIDMSRNDVNSLNLIPIITNILKIKKYNYIQHITSNLKGYLNRKISIIKIIKNTFPAGTLSGAPKKESIHLIFKYEKRKIFGGCFGFIYYRYISFAILIRIMIFINDKLILQSASGIVKLSNYFNEWNELNIKINFFYDNYNR